VSRAAGMEAEGIFRVSGEQIDIVALKQEFENASDPSSITFAESTCNSSCAVRTRLLSVH
jgi:hypothetical protein